MFFETLNQDPMHPAWFHGTAERVIFKKASVLYAISEDGQATVEQPRADNTIRVTAVRSEGGNPELINEAWTYLAVHAGEVEACLRRILWREATRVLCFARETPSAALKQILKKVDLAAPGGLDLQVAPIGIGLFDHGPEGVGYTTFEFNVGWDLEHGRSIAFHRLLPLASTGIEGFYNRSPDQIEVHRSLRDLVRSVVPGEEGRLREELERLLSADPHERRDILSSLHRWERRLSRR